MSERPVLDRLCEHVGLETSYWDVTGTLHQVPRTSLVSLLAAMGYEAGSDDAAAETLAQLQAKALTQTLPPVAVLYADAAAAVDVRGPAKALAKGLEWRIRLEDGNALDGTASGDELALAEAYQAEGEDYCHVRLGLPEGLPLGYHELSVSFGAQNAVMKLIIAPRHAYLPPGIDAAPGIWGMAQQVYALRGDSDWGIGGFSDLATVCDRIADAGGDAAGVNPLHMLFPSNADAASPYSPSSRLFLNPIYIDVETVPEYVPALAAKAGIKKLKATAAGKDSVDYSAVWELKLQVLRAVFAEFVRKATPTRQAAFDQFVDERGEALARFATYQALEAHFGGGSPIWPEEYRSPDSAEVAAFAAAHQAEIRFHSFLQWLAHGQLSAVSAVCAARGMRVGLYGDLAVGADSAGADVWADPQPYVKGVTFGAPPDPLSWQGQNWGLPPFNPVRLRELGYQPFIDILRASMRYCGAVRIDHVMWMQRMFWIPAGCETSEGAYVQFPLDELLAVTALESRRNRCCVIGEDLGTVPEGFREKMAAHHLLCYRLMRFERYENGLFKRPDTYPELALASFGSHDLPPLTGFWQGRDLEVLDALHLLDGEDGLAREQAQRTRDREQLVAALVDQKLLPPDTAPDELTAEALIDAVHGFLASSPSRLVMANLEDVAGDWRQINVPGTYLEHPNWRVRAQKGGLAKAIAHLGKVMQVRRRR